MTELPAHLREMLQALLDFETDSFYGKCEFLEVPDSLHYNYLHIRLPQGEWRVHFTFDKLPEKSGLHDYVIRWRTDQGVSD